MGFDTSHWQGRLDELCAAHRVPGAALAVLTGGGVHDLATGVLHRGTGVETTTDSVFQLGSVAKVYTATLAMGLAEEGLLDLDAPVRDVLPVFSLADEEAAGIITPRHLLTHTSGLSCDLVVDTGRGDDCLARFVAACAKEDLDCPPGAALSYSTSGFSVLGRVVEVLTGSTWDRALRDRVLDPLGLDHTMTLPEEALRFRTAMGHTQGAGEAPEPTPAWDLMTRSSGPGAMVLATAGDVVRLARAHLEDGRAADGARVLSPRTVRAMRERQAESPDKWSVEAAGWGLGWTLYDWDGVRGFGHDGAATGQYSYLRAVPGAGVALALVTNGGGARGLYADLFGELLAALADVRMPDRFAPPEQPPAVDTARLTGTYRRPGVVITVTGGGNGLRMVYEFVDGMSRFSPPLEADLVPVEETATATVFAASVGGTSFGEDWMPVVFTTSADGTRYAYVGMRAAPEVA
ncbi:serine hydrolase domain-containing protein [Nocardiopsis tropica]|uniref:Serine hydrolase domain-containing protein n=1 Tax=Nocardiopsis tropica TaxID=109330 RepID=A0ABU7KRP9_9ACTN|nr:serine hydrolase domain-containing protein [Nocardiopsis umidischolae]MEE2051990.1 serine hydrolase domain-containing protein [Nocardiopsis umidischolae]